MARKDDLVRGYAHALFAVAEAEGAVETVEEELFRFARALEGQAKLREALTDLALPAERKRAVLEEVLGEQASQYTMRLLTFVVESGRARDLGAIVDRLAEVAAERRDRAVAEVRTAVPLSKQQERKLEKALGVATGKEVELRVIVDPEVIGGVLARVGDQVFDGTVRHRLEQARELVSEV